MINHKLPLTIILLGLLWLGLAACRATEPAEREPPPLPPPTPTLSLMPPIQPGDGTDLIDRLLERGILRVGIRVWPEADFSPPAFRGYAEGTLGTPLNGFEVDVAHLLADGLGLELALVEAYPPVILSGEWQGQWDVALASIVPFDQVPAEAMRFSQPYAYVPMGILVPIGNSSIETVEQLAGRRVGVLEYSAYERLLTEDGESLTVYGDPLLPPLPEEIRPVPLSNLQDSIRAMGVPTPTLEFEALFGPAPVFREATRNQAVKLAPQAENLGLQPQVVAAMPQDGLAVERLIAEINTVLDRAEGQGFLAELYLHWYGQDLSQPGE